MWSRGGTAIGTNGRLYVTTGDGAFNPATGDYGSTFLAASIPELKIIDAFSPSNWNELTRRDLDLPSGGELFFSYRDHNLIVGGGKEAVVYLLDADSLGSKDRRTPLYVSPQLGNQKRALEEKGFWGSPALWRDEHGEPWIYVPLWGEPSAKAVKLASSNGVAQHGSILGFKVDTDPASNNPQLRLMWISPDVNLPDAPAVANGVVFVLATGENPQQNKVNVKKQDWKQNLLTTEEREQGTHPAVLMALDAKTGKLLYSAKNAMRSWNHFGGLAIDDGHIYVVDHSSRLYCFGLKSK
jgi:outer membrane protein assembly factor BamB